MIRLAAICLLALCWGMAMWEIASRPRLAPAHQAALPAILKVTPGSVTAKTYIWQP